MGLFFDRTSHLFFLQLNKILIIPFCMKFYFLFALFSLSPLFSFEWEFPKKFFFTANHVVEDYITGYILETDYKETFGVVEKIKGSLHDVFIFKDNAKRLLSLGRVTQEPGVGRIELEIEEHYCGSIQHTVSSLGTGEYTIYDEQERPIGFGAMNWLASRFTITSIFGARQPIATFCRPFFRLPVGKDYWRVEIHDIDLINPRLLLMIGAFQSELEIKNRVIKRGRWG